MTYIKQITRFRGGSQNLPSIRLIREYSSSSKFKFYDIWLPHAKYALSQEDDAIIRRQKEQRERPQVMVFDPLNGVQPPSYDDIFSDKNESAKSSRRDVSYKDIYKLIAGIRVPKKPIEPDSCCMSGCINCVWDLFNEDLQYWKAKTQEAVKALEKQENNIKEKWPPNFDPPPGNLPLKYIPKKLWGERGEQHVKYEIPIGLKVLQEFEEKKREAKLARAQKEEAEKKRSAQRKVGGNVSDESRIKPPGFEHCVKVFRKNTQEANM
ncbi:hypothetical protein HII12_002171 [Brettanomyces bruxellensis]|uniref:DEBR0S3_06370g1_1 n=1 Tax=Dekkera bruxellensis TaxID=5007 RepID=A0A7D9CXR9_DEKBR|nr:hypothetical protein HII12_002171 [Brettanomyces bruxellensis]VUG18271.1 DEBR0S3_06370g1_1 [Brettanomyces bruxellensis]